MSRDVCKGRSPIETLTRDTPNISEYLDFDFYSWVKFHALHLGKGSDNELGCWLGVATNVGQAMCYYVLKQMRKFSAVYCATTFMRRMD